MKKMFDIMYPTLEQTIKQASTSNLIKLQKEVDEIIYKQDTTSKGDMQLLELVNNELDKRGVQ